MQPIESTRRLESRQQLNARYVNVHRLRQRRERRSRTISARQQRIQRKARNRAASVKVFNIGGEEFYAALDIQSARKFVLDQTGEFEQAEEVEFGGAAQPFSENEGRGPSHRTLLQEAQRMVLAGHKLPFYLASTNC
jgi:hypothetical protein